MQKRLYSLSLLSTSFASKFASPHHIPSISNIVRLSEVQRIVIVIPFAQRASIAHFIYRCDLCTPIYSPKVFIILFPVVRQDNLLRFFTHGLALIAICVDTRPCIIAIIIVHNFQFSLCVAVVFFSFVCVGIEESKEQNDLKRRACLTGSGMGPVVDGFVI